MDSVPQIYTILIFSIYKVLAILYRGGEAAKQEPRLLGTVENEVSIVTVLGFGYRL